MADTHARSVVHGDVLHRLQRLRARDADVAHVADIENAHPVANRQMLFHQAADGGIFHRHVPAVEVDHFRAHLAMDGIQGSLANGVATWVSEDKPESFGALTTPESQRRRLWGPRGMARG